jgi:nitrite reductase (NADH) large subunit
MALRPSRWRAPKGAQPALASEPTVIVGAGPAGLRVALELLAREPASSIALYGDEPWELYQRVRLTALAMGGIDLDGVTRSPAASPESPRD